MSNDILQKVRVVLHGTTALTLDSVSYLIGEAEAEAARLVAAQDTDKALLLNIDTPEDQYPEIEARMVRNEMDHARLAGAIPRLHDLVAKMREAELAARQDERYEEVKKQCKAIEKTVDRFYDEFALALTAALHEARRLQIEIDVFNNPAPPNVLVNPQDRLVKPYKPIKLPVPDAVLKGLHLVAKDGAKLYAPVDVPKATMRPMANAPTVKGENFAPEKEALRQAQEARTHAQAILRGLEHEAEARGISVEQAATIEGMDAAEVERYREQGAGKQVDAAMAALRQAMAAELEKSTS
jgi:hypothetical protein